jgi:ring-1,2-phenylacetyl-CoA epoxidase subunit PaaE
MLRFHPLKVLSVAPEAADAIEIALEVPEGLREEYRGAPGQHVVVCTRLGEEQLRRTYSLISAPGESPLRIVPRVHASGRMSTHLAETLRAGQTLEVLPPNGSFTPRSAAAAGTYVAFAAGCGITPVLPVLRALLAGGAARVLLFYGNTSTARSMCLEELLALKDRNLARLALHFVMSREPQEVELYNGRLDASRVLQFAQQLFEPRAVREYFVCGPGNMIESVGAALRSLGVEPARIHSEHFTLATTEAGAQSENSAPAAAAASPQAGEAQVTILMDGRRRAFTMKADAETVLEGAARAGIELPFSCRAGVCSTCRTKVVQGEVTMTQNYALEDWELEQGYVLACQSHIKRAPLELDYDEK